MAVRFYGKMTGNMQMHLLNAFAEHITRGTDGTNLYVVDTSNETIRKIVMAAGAVTTLAGPAGS